MSTLTERWASLRDREALGDVLSPSELADAGRIESLDPDVQTYVHQMRELETYLEGKRGEHATAPDHQLVLRALSAVQLDAPSPRVRAIDHDRELARAADPEGPGWIRLLATALSVGMTVAAALALVLYEPRSVRRADTGAKAPTPAQTGSAPATALSPKVEALLQVRTSERGARLRRSGEVLAPATLLGQSDSVSSGDKAGCFVVEGELEFCLAAGSSVTLKVLAENNLALELERGHLSLHGPSKRGIRRVTVDAHEVRVVAESPVTFGLDLGEPAAQLVRARVLRGRVRMVAAAQSLDVPELKSAVYRRDGRVLDVVDLLPGPAQHEWDLVGTGRLGAMVASMMSGAGDRARGESVAMQEPVAELERAPRELMQDAWELLKEERWQEAANVYQRIAREAPHSEESHIVLVRLGDLLLERLADPVHALSAFDRYLSEGGGPLAAEARHGRIAVFRRLGRVDDERAAIEEFLRFHEKSTEAPQLQARLRVLAP
ncbi:MAG: hypothetical protein QM778_36550 [Myxococcales bacterium]